MNKRNRMLPVGAAIALTLAFFTGSLVLGAGLATAQPAPLLVASAQVLPSHTFVLANGSVVATLPQGMGLQPASATTMTPATGSTINVTATVVPSRLIVVDGKEAITAIYSNTSGVNIPFYVLVVRQGGQGGPEHPLTSIIVEQYNQLLPTADWQLQDKVYG